MAMPVWRKTRCRIFRMAAESSTTKTSGSMELLTRYSSERVGCFISGTAEITAEGGLKEGAGGVDGVTGEQDEPPTQPAGDRRRIPEPAGPEARYARGAVR